MTVEKYYIPTYFMFEHSDIYRSGVTAHSPSVLCRLRTIGAA